MSEQEGTKYLQVETVGPVDGPVGWSMDVGIWLNFDTDQGKIRLKLSHTDAAELQKRLKAEKSIAAGS